VEKHFVLYLCKHGKSGSYLTTGKPAGFPPAQLTVEWRIGKPQAKDVAERKHHCPQCNASCRHKRSKVRHRKSAHGQIFLVRSAKSCLPVTMI